MSILEEAGVRYEGDFGFVKLPQPIEKDGNMIDELKVRKPLGGDLRRHSGMGSSIKVTELVEFDFDHLSALLPRISSLTERDMMNLDPQNIMPIGVVVAGFFMDVDEALKN